MFSTGYVFYLKFQHIGQNKVKELKKKYSDVDRSKTRNWDLRQVFHENIEPLEHNLRYFRV